MFTSSIPRCRIFYNKSLSPAVIAGYKEDYSGLGCGIRSTVCVTESMNVSDDQPQRASEIRLGPKVAEFFIPNPGM